MWGRQSCLQPPLRRPWTRVAARYDAGSSRRQPRLAAPQIWQSYFLTVTQRVEGGGDFASAARHAVGPSALQGRVTPEKALRIEKAFGPAMDHLPRMQLA